MEYPKPSVKHITMRCSAKDCGEQAFVQVLVVPETELQPKIDARARKKLKTALTKAHEDGDHDQ